MQLLIKWSGMTQLRLDLAYRCSDDGSTIAQFHEKVEGRGDSFIFVKSESGAAFGAFITKPWATPVVDDTRHHDESAYLFSLSHKTKHPVY